MMRRIKMLESARISRLLISLAFAAIMLVSGIFYVHAAPSYDIHIDPGAYTGQYFFNCSFTTQLTGAQTFQLDPGNYCVDVGGSNPISFTVDASGQVANISPAAAAQAIGSTLRFNTTTITINPQNYVGRYFLTSHRYPPTYGEFSGVQNVALVPGLRYGLDNGGFAATSYGTTSFGFTVDANGEVISGDNPAATHASGNTLFFNTTTITINPVSYTGPYYLSSHRNTANFGEVQGVQTYVVIPALIYGIDAGGFGANAQGSTGFNFLVNGSGQMTNFNPSISASSNGSTLIFGNVRVHTDPTTYAGTYRLGLIFGLAGPSDVVLIPGLLTGLEAGGQGDYVVPTLFSVNPSSITLTIAGQSQTFLFNVVPQAPACSSPSFGPPHPVATGNGPGYLAIADFNNDGKFDMAVTNLSDNTVSIQMGDGAGGFTSTSAFATPSTPNSVEAGDFNNDGKLDLAIPCYSGASCAVMLGDGAGGFTTTAILPVPGNARYAALGDFNSDGKLDVAVTDQGKINIRVFFGDGAGNFSEPTILNAASFPYGLKTTDLNGDGKLDLVTTNFQSCSISVLLGDGNGGFAPPVSFSAGCTPVNLAFADFNRDGKVDVVIGDELSSGVSVLLGNGAGGFGAPTFFATGDHATTVAAADFNGDNNPDIAVQVRFGNSGVAVLLGDGTGSFSAPTYFPFGEGPFALAAADLNRDGKPDIAVADPSTTNVYILLNTCSPADTTPPTITCPANVVASNDANQCSANVNAGAATAMDNVDGALTPIGTRSDGQPLTSPYPVGTTTITWTATDHAGNSSSCQQTITINDTQPPTITCPANINRNTDAGSCSAVVTYAATASDNCSSASVACSPPSGAAFPKGTTTVNCTATDTAGNTAACSFTVTVVDNQAPQINCPANIVANNNAGLCSAVVAYPVTVTDNCPGVTVVSNPPSGAVFPVGTTTVTATATDAAGNLSSCSFTVTVVDAQPPTITTCAANRTLSTNGASQIALPNLIGEVTATDNCTAAAALIKTQSPAAGTMIGLGNTTVTLTVKDAANNAATCAAVVTVVKFNVGEFVVFSSEYTKLSANTEVNTGNVGASTSLPDPNGPPDDKEEVEIGERVQMLQAGSNVVGDTVRLRANAQVYNVHFNESVFSNQATILGSQVTPQTLPVVAALPALPRITPGTQDVEVATNQTLTLAPGSYRNITVKSKGTLIMTGGIYHILSFDIRQEAKILFQGPSEVRIKNEMDTDAKAVIGPDASAPRLQASQIIFYIQGTDDQGHPPDGDPNLTPTAADIGERNTVVANIYAPNGTVRLRANTTATGAYIGKQALIGERVELTLKSAF